MSPLRRRSAGFTLVELLVVIVIIGILAGLASVAAVAALGAAKDGRMKSEVNQLDEAFRAYKEKHGSYPPSNMADTAAVKLHLQKAFPRWNPALDPLPTNLSTYTPAQALVFWLSGFSNDAQRPFTGGEKTAFFPFDKARLVPNDGSSPPVYVARDSRGAPYVYFEVAQYAKAGPPSALPPGLQYVPTAGQPGAGICRPYLDDTNRDGAVNANERFCNEASFQIICAGQDGNFGTTPVIQHRLYPTGTNYSAEDGDNITNFSDRTLENSKP